MTLADLTETVEFRYENAEYTLNLPFAITNNKLANVRKLFFYMCNSNDYERRAAKKTATMLFNYVSFCYDQLKMIVKIYSNERQDVSFISDPYDKRKATQKNKHLDSKLKKADREYKKAQKLRDEFVKTYEKYN